MKKQLLSVLLALPFFASAQFVENFDSSTSTPSGWTVINGGDTETFIFIEGAPGSAFTQKNAAQINYSTPAHDDYLVTPAITVTANVNDRLTFWVKNQDPAYVENYDVRISTTTPTAAAFTTTLIANGPAPNTWTQQSIDLTPYLGQTVYIGLHATSADKFRLLFDNVVSDSPNNGLQAPGCVSLTTPANGATGIDPANPINFTWDVAASGGQTEYYELYLDTNPSPTTRYNNYSATSASVTGLNTGATYYWKVVGKNAAGASTGCSQMFSFTTKADPFSPYCSTGLLYSSGVEPITNVKLQEINNTSSALTSSVPLENFISQVATLEQGKTYTISFQGNTDGNYTDNFILFIDWNQNGSLADSGEQFFGSTATKVQLVNSTGVDGKTASGTFTVPATATLGNTRMRVKKNFGGTSFYLSPCYSSGTTVGATSGTAGFGQAEDYTVKIIAPVLATSETAKERVSVYPNPFVDILKISDIKGVKSVSVADASGRQVQTLEPAKELDLSSLQAGVYVISLHHENGSVKSYKVIKK